MDLVVDQSRTVVFFGEPLNEFAAVLKNSSLQVAGYARVQDGVAGAGEDVNEPLFHCESGLPIRPCEERSDAAICFRVDIKMFSVLDEIASLALAMTIENFILFRGEPIAPEQKIASLRSQ